MAFSNIGVGSSANDGTGDPLRTAFQTVNSNFDDAALRAPDINAQTGTSYTLVAADEGKLVTLENASDIVLTVPANASEPIPVGGIIVPAQLGAGQVTISPASGVTINTAEAGLKISAQYGMVTLIKIDTDTWLASGKLTS